MKNYINARFAEAQQVMSDMLADNHLKASLEAAAKACVVCFQDGGKILVAGNRGGPMQELCDYLLEVHSDDTPTIQESHLVLGHILCGLVENAIFKVTD